MKQSEVGDEQAPLLYSEDSKGALLKALQKCKAFFIGLNYSKTTVNLQFVVLDRLQMIIKTSELLYLRCPIQKKSQTKYQFL